MASNASVILGGMQSLLTTQAKAAPILTYERVCSSLKFCCGFNPKTVEGIKEMVNKDFPSLTDVSVRIEDGYYVSIFFRMPWGERKRFFYPR